MEITLRNGKKFHCQKNQTIFDSAREGGVFLEHSCLNARCRSCAVQILNGETGDKVEDLVLSNDEKKKGMTLSCNAIALSDLLIDAKDLGDVLLYNKKIVPAKIDQLKLKNNEVLEVVLRLPPKSNFKYISGQYVNIIKGSIKRSYSVANAFDENGKLHFFIKKYNGGEMSKYWFNEAKVNDLLRIEGPLGCFFIRESEKDNIIFLATGTGIAPVKAILEDIEKNNKVKKMNKSIWIFNGACYSKDFIWNSHQLLLENTKYIPVTSRENSEGVNEKKYVQDAVLQSGIDLTNS